VGQNAKKKLQKAYSFNMAWKSAWKTGWKGNAKGLGIG